MNQVSVRIPMPLRNFTDGADEVTVQGATVGDALYAMGKFHDGLLERLLTPEGEIRSFVNIYVGENNVIELDGLKTPTSEGDVISIIPAVAGG